MENVVSVDIFIEFLEVAIHSILYKRQLYPQNIFEKRKKYDIPVYISTHQAINKYIQDTLDAIKLLLKINLEKISVVIANKDHKPLEKFVFEIDLQRNFNCQLDDSYLLRLEKSIREFCFKLNVCDASLTRLPPECYFMIQVHTDESAAASMEVESAQNFLEFPWVEADPLQTTVNKAHILPLKFMDHEIFKMQLYVEESETKF
uniref:HORMA domain-containing protein n=1 Tax=Strigamia maritima TaxID=126957 RepID=T1ISE2_STRMM